MSSSKWKTIDASVRGTDHEFHELPCQDFSSSYVQQTAEGEVLIACCSDGAGSATFAQLGARFVCDHIIMTVADTISSGVSISSLDRTFFVEMLRQIRGQLEVLALDHESTLSQFACTCLFAVIGEGLSVWGQIGDGAMVISAPENQCEVVFWPHQGEYINTTSFLTSANWEEKLEIKILDQRIDELALLTDGLQMLALSYANRQAHAPFFSPMFRVLRDIDEPLSLIPQLETFLNSENVNRRTGDDKTLVLATRLTNSA